MSAENYVKVDHEPADHTIRVYDVNGDTDERCFDYYRADRDKRFDAACDYAERLARALGCEWGSN